MGLPDIERYVRQKNSGKNSLAKENAGEVKLMRKVYDVETGELRGEEESARFTLAEIDAKLAWLAAEKANWDKLRADVVEALK